MTRFRPTVESLDDRALPSAVFATPDAPTAPAVQLAESGEPAPGDATATAKVSMRDFNFTTKVNKSSPALML
jgi:hypothetical protein